MGWAGGCWDEQYDMKWIACVFSACCLVEYSLNTLSGPTYCDSMYTEPQNALLEIRWMIPVHIFYQDADYATRYQYKAKML